MFAAALIPFALDVWPLLHDGLGPHPYRVVIDDTGQWTLWFVAATLALTPLRRFTSWHWLARYRRMIGLFAFFYAVVHTATYLVFDRVADLDASIALVSWAAVTAVTASTARDVASKPFLVIGLAAFLMLVPLAATSSAAMIRALGGATWRRLHRLVYAIAIAGLLHHWWPLADRFRLDRYALVILPALAYRIARANRRIDYGFFTRLPARRTRHSRRAHPGAAAGPEPHAAVGLVDAQPPVQRLTD